MAKLYFQPEQYGDHYAILPSGSVEGNPYGSEISYIHAKFGRLKKAYNFTDDCRKRFPEFVAEYEKYWNSDTTGMFQTALDVANYLIAHPEAGEAIRPYFNFIDEWAYDWQAIKVYLEQEAESIKQWKIQNQIKKVKRNLRLGNPKVRHI